MTTDQRIIKIGVKIGIFLLPSSQFGIGNSRFLSPQRPDQASAGNIGGYTGFYRIRAFFAPRL